MPDQEIHFDGLSEQQILSLPHDEVDQLILLGKPLVFRAGTATLLGCFRINDNRLVVELAQIEGGGEGVLVSLASLVLRFAKSRNMAGVEWIVHAVTCAKPNPKLRRVLERRGFVVKHVAGIGEAYYLLDSYDGSAPTAER